MTARTAGGAATSRVLLPAAVAATVAGMARAPRLRAAVPGGADRWQRTNHRGEPVTLLQGPAWGLGALAAVATASSPGRVRAGAALAVGAAAVLGGVDDLAGDRAGPTAKGLRGHLGALAARRPTTGALKVAGIGAAGVAAAAALLPPGRTGRARLVDVVVAGGVVAGSANLVNLFDLRPGRALKVTVLASLPAVASRGAAAPLAAAAAGASLALLPDDLGERSMLGDAGANAAGALVGAALVAGTAGVGAARADTTDSGRGARGLALAVLVALTLASERVSFTRVIETTPVLRALDRVGRRPAPA